MSDQPKPRKEQDPDAFMNAAREQLQKQREEVLQRQATINEELATLDGKLARVEAYFAPPPATVEPKTRAPRKTGTRAPRQGGVREKVLEEIKKHQDGIKRADLLTAMGATGNKTAEQSISNAVANLKKDGKISGEQGIYKAV
jgi:hypothetical protein